MGLVNTLFGSQIQKAALEKLVESGLYNQNIFGWLGNGQPIYYDDNADTYIKEGYMSNGDVYACVDLILTKLAACPILVYEIEEKNLPKIKQYKNLIQSDELGAKIKAKLIETKAMTEVYVPQISDLLETPNKYDTQTDFIKNLGGFYLLTGNSYIYFNGADVVNKKWNEMFVLPSHFIEIISGGNFQPVKGYKIKGSEVAAPFPAEQVAHLKTFNPDFSSVGSQLYGMSPLKAHLLTLSKNKETKKEQGRQIKNGGSFGFISPDRPDAVLSADQKNDLKQQVVQAKNARDILERLFVSNGALKWTQVGLPSSDLQLLETLGADRVDIANAYHFPIQLLNNSEASTDNNMGWASKQLIYNAVMPLANHISDTLTRSICWPLRKKTGKNYVIMVDTTSLPEMQEDMEKVANWLDKSWWITPNEKREVQGWGKDANKVMNTPLVPSNLVPVNDLEISDDKFTNSFNDKDDE